jgi:Fe2+ transport system protein FeoA
MSGPNFEFVLDDLNVFRADAGISNDAHREPVSIRCPYCRELASFGVARGKSIEFRKRAKLGPPTHIQVYYASIRCCPNVQCHGIVFVIEGPRKCASLPRR